MRTVALQDAAPIISNLDCRVAFITVVPSDALTPFNA